MLRCLHHREDIFGTEFFINSSLNAQVKGKGLPRRKEQLQQSTKSENRVKAQPRSTGELPVVTGV